MAAFDRKWLVMQSKFLFLFALRAPKRCLGKGEECAEF